MEDGCLGCPGAYAVTDQPLDSITLLWLSITTTHPCGPPGTRHTELKVEMGREGGQKDRDE